METGTASRAPQTLRTLGAAVVAALVFGFAATLAIVGWAVATSGRPLSVPLGEVAAWVRTGFRLGLMAGLPGSLAVGLLVHAILMRLGLRTLAAYTIAGLLIGLLGAVAFVGAGGFDFGRRAGLADYQVWGLVGAFAGGCGGAAFWLTRRPR